ncbi:MAG: hypothetical protein WC852_02215 [Candidatus Nanoarchaeia archaeon]
MEIEKLKKNGMIKIGKDSYEIIYAQEEADYNPKTGKLRPYLEISLHKNGSSSLHPTHVIRYYPDNTEASLLEVKQEKPTVEHPRTRGSVFCHNNKKKINIKDIDIN